MAREGYVINPAAGDERYLQQPSSSDMEESTYGRILGNLRKKGISGYDPEVPDMRGVFMARGPGNCLLLLFYTNLATKSCDCKMSHFKNINIHFFFSRIYPK